MLTTENIQELKKDGYSFEDIQNIIKGEEDFANGNFIDEEEFWKSVYSKVNININKKQCII